MQSTPWETLGCRKHKLESRLLGEISITSDNADNTTLMAESEEKLKSLLMKVKEESEKNWLKTQLSENWDHAIWSHPFLANRWGNNRNSDRLYIFGLQNHCRCDWSHDIKRRLFLGRKVMTNLDSILKSRDITLPTKAHIVKALVFQ